METEQVKNEQVKNEQVKNARPSVFTGGNWESERLPSALSDHVFSPESNFRGCA